MTLHSASTFTNPVVTLSSPVEPSTTDPCYESLFYLGTEMGWGRPTSIPDDYYSNLTYGNYPQNTWIVSQYRDYSLGSVIPYGNIDGFNHTKVLGNYALESRLQGTQGWLYVPEAGRFITSPFQSTDPQFFLNGVIGDSRNNPDAVWLWDSLGDPSALRAHALGHVEVDPKPVNAGDPTRTVQLNHLVNKNLNLPSFYKNLVLDEIHSFSLEIGFKKTSNTGAPSISMGAPKNWSVKVIFGDFELVLTEGKSSMKVNSSKYKISKDFRLDTDSSQPLRRGSADRQINLTVIKVLNGLLISDLPPNCQNFGEKMTHIPLGGFSLTNELDDYAIENAKDSLGNVRTCPRYGTSSNPNANFTKTNNRGGVDELDGNDSVVNMKPNVYGGVVSHTFGNTITVDFVRGGGTLLYQPVLHGPNANIFLKMGHQEQCDSNITVTPPPSDNFFEEGYATVDSLHAIPYLYTFDGYYTMSNTFKRSDQSPDKVFYGLGVQHTSDYSAISTPIEFFGTFVYTHSNSQAPKYKNGIGTINESVIPPERIQQINVTRSLEGSSGSVVWDRFDPVTGLIDRPSQEVGAVSLSVTGGENTVGGTIFTGLAMGNSENDAEGSNTITVPLKGYEAKLSDSEGGMRIINAPYFDGQLDFDVREWLANYAGFSFVQYTTPYNLPYGLLSAPVVDFKTGTDVWGGIKSLDDMSATLSFFNRLGIMEVRGVGVPTGVNWSYPSSKLESYSDEPDLSSMRDVVAVAGLVPETRYLTPDELLSSRNRIATPQIYTTRLLTDPYFPWDKMAFFAFDGWMTQAELQRSAALFTYQSARPRASSSVTIPGNANIDLLDTFNLYWVITSISHTVDLVGKRWSTSLSLELLLPTTIPILDMCSPPD